MVAKPVWTVEQIVNQLAYEGTSTAPWSSSELGVPRELTFSFPTEAPPEDAVVVDYDTFAAFNADQTAAARQAVANFADVIDVAFTEVAGGGGDIRFMTLYHSSPTNYYSGMAYGPGPGYGGDVFINRFPNPNHDVVHPAPSEVGFVTFMHEIAHAMGLGHGGNYDGGYPTYAADALYAQDTQQYTVMSYFDRLFAENGSDHTYEGNEQRFAETLMLYDIAALQSLYGANPTTRAGDTTYGFNSNVGADSPYDFSQNIDPVVCIYDAGGVDTLDFSGFTERTRLDLGEGAFSDTARMAQNVSIAFGTVIENANGGSAADLIVGNAIGNVLRGNGGADNLEGLDGDDTIFGGGNPTSGISLGSGVFRDQSASNGARSSAVDISRLFSLRSDGDISNSTTVPHVQIRNLNTTASRDYFKLTINNVGAVITLDADHTPIDPVFVDTFVQIFDSKGVLKAENDTSYGSDPGSQHGNDSLLEYTVTKPGTYFISVGNSGDQNLPAGGSYELQVSVAGERFSNEKLKGGNGADTLFGQKGQDDLNGGLGADTISGGAGRDSIIFNTTLGPSNVDTITDFVAGDTIKLDDAIFTRLGTWSAAKFWASATGAAHDASDRIVYETDTGKLLYDADGNRAGGRAAVLFAQLGTNSHPLIDAGDFAIV
jgi:serralysin